MFPTPHAIVPSLQARVHPDEWQVRLQLAACYRVFAMLGWTEMIYNHITLRVPESATGGDKHFLINPFGLHYSEVTASNLVKINLAGDILCESKYPINPAGYVLHSAIHDGVPGAHCVMHTHTTAGVAVASLASGLSQSNFYSAQLHGMVAYHDFEGIALNHEERERLVRDLGMQNKALILRNHGLLTVGNSVAEAFILMVNLERACRVQVAIQSSGQIAYPVPTEVCKLTAQQYESGASNRLPGSADPHAREWRALKQRLHPCAASSHES